MAWGSVWPAMGTLQLCGYEGTSTQDRHGVYIQSKVHAHLGAIAGQEGLGAFVPGAGTRDSALVRKVLLIFLWACSCELLLLRAWIPAWCDTPAPTLRRSLREALGPTDTKSHCFEQPQLTSVECSHRGGAHYLSANCFPIISLAWSIALAPMDLLTHPSGA